jgi:retron-type reverse transcriptase
MRREKCLYARIAETENLLDAFHESAKGKGTSQDVIDFRRNIDANIAELRSRLKNREYVIGNYFFFTIRDPKVRKICASDFPERVLHHAIMNVCEEAFESFHIHDSYACRKGKGNQKALARARQFARRHSWYLKLDIRKYFDSIDHDIALALLKRRFKDAALLELFARILDSYHVSPGKGIPIGNLFSQYLANFYLAFFDHWIKEDRKVKAYVRYMDDFLLFSNDKEILCAALNEIRDFLKTRLALTLKNDVQINRTACGVPFLGARVFPAHTILQTPAMKRYSKKYRHYEKNYREGVWPETDLACHMEALNAFAKNCDSHRFRNLMIDRFGVLS